MIYVLIGYISGIFSGSGMGGGTILILLLTFFMGTNQHIAQATNLIFFIPTSISAIIVNRKNKSIDVKLAWIISVCGIIGAIIGATIATRTHVENLKKYFGLLLAIIAINETYKIIKEYIKRKKRHNKIRKME